MTTSHYEVANWAGDAERIIRSVMGDELRKHLAPKLTFTIPDLPVGIHERINVRPYVREDIRIESQFIFMPGEQWEQLKGMLKSIIQPGLPASAQRILEKVIYEIEEE